MSETPPFTRRSLFGLAASGLLSGNMPVTLEPALAMGPADRERPQLEVAGPRDSALGGWARTLEAPLASGLSRAGGLDLRFRGGVDGVTASNQFEARAVPDGQDALLFGGSVPLAWLAGEGMVRLDASHLLPVFAAFGPGVLMVRGALPSPGPRRAGAALRVAVGAEPNAALTALLGLDLVGIAAVPVRVSGDAVAAAQAGAADAVFVHGSQALMQAGSLRGAGFAPTLSVSAAAGQDDTVLGAPSFLAELPAWRLQSVQQGKRVAAWRALASASGLCAVLVVPRLTPRDALGRWRKAARLSLADDAVRARADVEGLRLADGADAAAALAPMQAGFGLQLTLRQWIAERGLSRHG